MVRLPWRGRKSGEKTRDDESSRIEEGEYHRNVDPIVSCTFQDGALFVFEDQIFIERPSRSQFSDKWISMDRIRNVRIDKRLMINYVQIEQADFENAEGSLLSAPVDENTLHFGGGKRDCARRAMEEILERIASGSGQ